MPESIPRRQRMGELDQSIPTFLHIQRLAQERTYCVLAMIRKPKKTQLIYLDRKQMSGFLGAADRPREFFSIMKMSVWALVCYTVQMCQN